MKDTANTYFPERFVRNRNFINKAIGAFNNTNVFNDDETDKLRDLIIQASPGWRVIEDLLRGDERSIFAEKTIKENNPDKWKWWQIEGEVAKARLKEEIDTTKSIISFYRNGRNIFSLSSMLMKMLDHTDIGNIRFSDIKLPYNSIYIHFGSQIDFQYNFGFNDEIKTYHLDGAFISIDSKNRLDVRLTLLDDNGNFEKGVADIWGDLRFHTINLAVDFAKLDNNSEKVINNISFNDSFVYLKDNWAQVCGNKLNSVDFGKIKESIKRYENSITDGWEYDLTNKSLMIIINTICYLNSIDDTIEVSTTDARATELVRELSQTKKHQQRTKINEKLKKFSYSTIHFCGNKLQQEYKNVGTGSEMEPHWRRGHWRNQPFGAGLINKKLIWIKPIIVRRDKGEPGAGHIYEIESTNNK